MKILWVSANMLGYEVFPELLDFPEITISGIVTLAPSTNTIMYDGIPADEWKKWNIPVFEVENIGDKVDLIQSLAPDLIVMCGWRQIIPSSLLAIPKQGIIGFHPTLLPIGRGPAPIINSIIEGVTETGVTMYYLDEGLDCGDIVGQSKFSITEDDYAIDVYNKIILATKLLIRQYVPQIVKGTAPRIQQDHSKATYFPKRTLEDNEINIETDNINIALRKIRALSYPYRGAFIRLSGEKLVIWKAGFNGDEK